LSRRFAIALFSLSLAAVFATYGQDSPPTPPSTTAGPADSGLVERTGRRLVQLDVTVRGAESAIVEMAEDDFLLSIAGRTITDFTVDDLCHPLTADDGPDRDKPEAAATSEATVEPAATEIPRATATFLFYFDQTQLSIVGRHRSLDLARDLARELIVDGNRALVISAGREVRTYTGMTSDIDELLAAFDEIAVDRTQWDPQIVFENEESQVERVVEALNDNDQDRAVSLARQYQQEESWRTGKSLQLLSMAIGRLADVGPPKAVVYFADNMRKNAGAHYLSFFGEATRRGTDQAAFRAMEMSSFGSNHAFDRVVEQASANGVRLYTVQAEGLVTLQPALTITQSAGAGRSSPSLSNQRVKDAQNSLVGMAAETGGQAFLHGVRAAKISKAIQADLSCLYLISFDPGTLPEDQNLPVNLRTSRRKVKLQVKGILVIQSEKKRLSSRLLAAFAAPEAVSSELAIAGAVVPTGFQNGKFTALVQISVPGSPMAGTVWDLGLSLVARGRVREDASGRISISGPSVPAIFETQMTFSPGPFQLISVAHETSTDALSTGRVEGSWPDPDAAPAVVGPIAVLQPTEGAFLRNTEFRSHGSRAIGAAEAVRTELPTAIVGIVCRGSGVREIRLERRLAGEVESWADFTPQYVSLSEEQCALFVDRIREHTMDTGMFRYEVRVLEGRAELTSAVHEFRAIAPEDLSAAAGPS